MSDPYRYYKREALIGQGMFGEVYLARDRRSNRVVAIKKIRVGENRLRDGLDFTALREIKYLAELRHDNVLELIEMFEHKKNLFMVLQLMVCVLFPLC